MERKKPIVFNYQDYVKAMEDNARLNLENQELRDKLINAEIRIRILTDNANQDEL